MYWPGFTVYMTYSDISLSSMYINHCEMSVELPYLRYIVVPFASKAIFKLFWRILSSPFTVVINRRTRVEFMFWRAPALERFFPRESNRFAFKSSQQKSRKIHVSCHRKSIQKACGILILWMEVGLFFFSLHSKRFQSSYCRLLKVRAGGKKMEVGMGWGKDMVLTSLRENHGTMYSKSDWPQKGLISFFAHKSESGYSF